MVFLDKLFPNARILVVPLVKGTSRAAAESYSATGIFWDDVFVFNLYLIASRSSVQLEKT